ncbi:MAG: LacI family DNA-binding transcriptional regulator, partial [Bacteroidales bacterium]|nr:LacI family DNA-binding transcriptional regulator [Bacteroidales bacterium]
MAIHPVTIKDIAKLLGISKSTVSRALKDHPDISQTTKDAVLQLAEALRYRPNAVALSLRHKKSKVIGLIVPQISYFFFPSVVEGVEDEVHKHGYKLMILTSNEQYEREVEACDILLSNNVEGILASVSRKTRDFKHFHDIIDSDIPMVFFDRVPDSVQADMVLVDDIDGAYNATKHLFDIGKKRIAICIGNPNLLISKNRLKGYQMAFEENKRLIDENYIISCETPVEAENETTRLLNLPNPPDGILAISDLTMSGIMKAIYKNKLRIPEDIAVIGFCEEPFSSMYNPPLSTIKPMGFEIGKTAAEMLFKRI